MNAIDLPAWAVIPAAILLVGGGLVSLVGAFGFLRLNNFYARAHALTMTNTLGAMCVLLASTITASAMAGHLAIHELLLIVLILLVSPVTTIILMRAAVLRDKSRQERSE